MKTLAFLFLLITLCMWIRRYILTEKNQIEEFNIFNADWNEDYNAIWLLVLSVISIIILCILSLIYLP